MPNDTFRAVQNFFRNVMHSNLARYVTRSGILSLVETHAPELHPFVERNFDPVWTWIVENLF
jgi:hypothetical protein